MRSRLGVNRPPGRPTGRPPMDPASHCSYAPQSPRVIQLPAGSLPVARLIRSTNSPGWCTSCRFTPKSSAPVAWMCTCPSLKPGKTCAPWRSMVRVVGPAYRRTSAFEPAATIHAPSTAMAATRGRALSSVYTLPLTRIRSAVSRDAHPAKPRHSRKPRHGFMTDSGDKSSRRWHNAGFHQPGHGTQGGLRRVEAEADIGVREAHEQVGRLVPMGIGASPGLVETPVLAQAHGCHQVLKGTGVGIAHRVAHHRGVILRA